MLTANSLHKTYHKHKIDVPVLRGLELEVNHGEFLSIVGASGSGKSTLLHLLGTLDKPDSGSILLEGRRIDNLPSDQREELRNRTFGFIFQFYHLLPELSTLENVLIPSMISHSLWRWFGERRALKLRAKRILDQLGLSHRLKHKPRELSGGEMQRAAIARALINEPRILLADEPTGNLDMENAAEVMARLRDLNRHEGLTIIMVTHNHELAIETDRIVKIVAGRMDHSVPESPGLLTAAVEHP